MENVSHKSPRVSRVDGFLHRSDTHRPSAVRSAIAYAFVQHERTRPHPGPRLTFPQVRAFVQEIFTGLLFVSRPRYMQWMKQAEQRFLQLRI